MKKLGAVSLCITAFGAATIVAACGPDTTTLPPDYLGDGASGGSSGGTTSAGGSTSIAGSSQSATGGSSSLGGTSALGGGTGGTGTGGTGTGGTGTGGGGVPTSAGGAPSNAGTTSTMGGMAGAAQTGGAGGRGGAGGTGFGFGGRGLGGRGNAGAAGASGSSGSAGAAAGSSGGQTVSFAEVGAFIQKTCADAKCHGGKERPSLLNTTPSTLYNTLKTTTVRQCGSDHLATPGDTANSALLELVQHQCGMFVMPDGCTTNPCIDAASLTLLTTWIQQGAPGP